MIFGAAPGWVVDTGVIFGSLVAFTTFMGAVLKSRPGRWLAREVGKDVEGWVETIAERVVVKDREWIDARIDDRLDEILPAHLQPVLHELRTNGGGSFRDDVIRRLSEIMRRMDRFAQFMDESTMDRKDLREMFEHEIARSHAAERGEVNDRGDAADP